MSRVPTAPHVSIEEKLNRLESMRTTVGFPTPAQPQVRPHTYMDKCVTDWHPHRCVELCFLAWLAFDKSVYAIRQVG